METTDGRLGSLKIIKMASLPPGQITVKFEIYNCNGIRYVVNQEKDYIFCQLLIAETGGIVFFEKSKKLFVYFRIHKTISSQVSSTSISSFKVDWTKINKIYVKDTSCFSKELL